MEDDKRIMSRKSIEEFLDTLKSENIKQYKLSQYRRNIGLLMQEAAKNNYELNKDVLHNWKKSLEEKGYAKGTVTNYIVDANNYLRFMGWNDLCFSRGKRLDLSGEMFGKLRVLYPTDKRSADRSVIWVCRCEACGKEKEIPANQLKYGVQKSCGCQKKEVLYKANKYIDNTYLRTVMYDELRKNNTSGYEGVCKKNGHWQARIQYKKNIYYLGTYKKIEDAVRARKRAEDMVREDAKRLEDIYDEKLKKELPCINTYK